MNILECTSKKLCREYGIPVPRSVLLTDIKTITSISSEIQYPIILKAQMYSKNRSRIGGICLSRDLVESEKMLPKLFTLCHNDQRVSKVLAEEHIAFNHGNRIEIAYSPQDYLILLNASQSLTSLNSHGNHGDDKGETFTFEINPFIGIPESEIIELAIILDIEEIFWRQLIAIIGQLWAMFVDLDLIKITLNPLVIGNDGRFYALGVNIDTDDNARFRQREMAYFAMEQSSDDIAENLRKLNCKYRESDGVVCILTESMDMSLAIKDVLSSSDIQTAEIISTTIDCSSAMIATILQLIEAKKQAKLLCLHTSGDKIEMNDLFSGIDLYQKNSIQPIPIIIRACGDKRISKMEKNKKGFVYFVESIAEYSQVINEILSREIQ